MLAMYNLLTVVSKEVSQKGITSLFVFFYNNRFIRRDLPNKPIVTHRLLTVRGAYMIETFGEPMPHC